MSPSRPVRTALSVLCAWTVLCWLEIAIPGDALDGPWRGQVPYWGVIVGASGLMLLRAWQGGGRERGAWLLIGSGSLLWALADVYWTLELLPRDVIPVPSVADVGYVAFYPLVFAGLCLLVRARVSGAPRTLWIDGLSAALAAGALSAAIVVQVVLGTLGGGTLQVATNLAYPLGDLILLGVVAAALALRGWRVDRTWALLGAGIVLFWIADSHYLVTLANDTYTNPNMFDSGWNACLVLFGAAAWSPVRVAATAEDRESLRFVLFPVAFATLGLGILVLCALEALNPIAVVLAGVSLLAVLARLVVSLRENAAMLTTSRREALTDSLTELGNRRALTLDLDELLRSGRAAGLVLYDLDGFKHYNDTYGHPAGDTLLQRLGAKLAAHVGGSGRVYRMGGDEFCVLLDVLPAELDATAARSTHALSEEGDGFSIACSYGAVRLPEEASDAGAALRIADQRMYARKHSRRVSAQRQSRDVLLRALAERKPDLGDHLSGVASMAEAVARRLGLPDHEVEHVRHAADLHDVGKMAIPDAILDKAGPLDPEEWEFIHRHTIIGERIVGAAPALLPVAAMVRSSHERYDGRGYPDRLSGEQIPLGSRIVAVCDAFDAMIADRSYRAGMPVEDALAELDRCSGTQFDPLVVDAFVEAWAERPQELQVA
jgi:two-component system cell cycle response regulator